VFVSRDDFEARIAADGFLEWTDFLGQLYGTPVPEPVGEQVQIYEIELVGAKALRERFPDAVLIFVMPPSRDEQRRRLQVRGDSPDKVLARLRKAEEEEPIGLALADHVVVNDDLDRTVGELQRIIDLELARRGG
jgi:guanylate kinase